MKYCNTCGKLIPDRAGKCSYCGANTKNSDHLDQPSAKYFDNYVDPQEEPSLKNKSTDNFQDTSIPMKKNLFSIFPFFIIPGIGFMYAGNMKKGIKFFLSFLAVVFVDVFTKVVLLNYFLVYLVIPLYLTLIIWGIVGSNKEIRNYNSNIENINQKQYPSKKSASSVYQ